MTSSERFCYSTLPSLSQFQERAYYPLLNFLPSTKKIAPIDSTKNFEWEIEKVVRVLDERVNSIETN